MLDYQVVYGKQPSFEWCSAQSLGPNILDNDTMVYSNIAQTDDCDNLQSDLNTMYNIYIS